MLKQLTRITCQEAHKLLSQRHDAPLPALGRYRLFVHLKVCDMCARVDQQFDLIRKATRGLGK
jgi:hypothetical protein